MHEAPTSTGFPDCALELHCQGLRLIPLAGKRALLKDWPHLHLGESDIRSWSRRGVNWGILTGDPLVVLDTDTEAAESWVQARGIDSPVAVRTGAGGLHRYFRSPEQHDIHSRAGVHRIAGLDVRAWHSYIVAAGSIHPESRQRYAYLPGKELTALDTLPLFDPAWVREQPNYPKLNETTTDSHVRGHMRDVRAYFRRIPSIDGQGGDKACFTVACLLVEAGLDYPRVLAEIEAWNQECAFGPWSEQALKHKVRSAFNRVLGIDVGQGG